MRKLHFLLTLFVSMLIMLGADVNHMLQMYGLAAGLWVLFILAQQPRLRQIEARRRRAYMQELCMRTYLRKNGVRW